MAQQTALEWFLANLPDRFKNALITACEEEIKQAKEMEKEQIIDACFEGMNTFPFDANKGRAEQYYEQTYKTK